MPILDSSSWLDGAVGDWVLASVCLGLFVVMLRVGLGFNRRARELDVDSGLSAGYSKGNPDTTLGKQ